MKLIKEEVLANLEGHKERLEANIETKEQEIRQYETSIKLLLDTLKTLKEKAQEYDILIKFYKEQE